MAVLEADEVEGKTVKMLKMQLAERIGASRFRQRWYSQDQRELLDDELVSESDVQLVMLSFVTPNEGQDQKLILASAENRLEEVESLLSLPIDPEGTDEDGVTALHHAAFAGHSPCVSLLLEAHAAVDKEDANGSRLTALYWALEEKHMGVVRLLLQAGADKDKDRITSHRRAALHIAVASGHSEVVKLLLKAGADTDNNPLGGQTALHLAAENGNLEIMRLLLEAGADKDKKDLHGRTALDVAAQEGRLEPVRLLLAAGAKHFLKAMSIARWKGHKDVVQLLQDAVPRNP